MLFSLFILFSFIINMSNSIFLPMVGSNYRAKITIPYIGYQKINIFQIERKRSVLILQGIINTEGSIYYKDFDNIKKKYNYTLDNNLNNIIKKYKCELLNAYYDSINDQCFVDINIKLFNIRKSIILSRVLE